MSDTKKLEQKINKMASVIAKQQKIIEKLAQCLQGDPLCGIDGKMLDEKDDKKKPAPSPKPAQPKPDTHKAEDALARLPQDLLLALEANAPQLKGSLLVQPQGNSLEVKYNANRVKGGANAVKSMLEQALSGTGYQLGGVVGVMDSTFKANA